MTNAQVTARFFSVIDAQAKAAILENIARHYGITPAQALTEVLDDSAEHLLDYVTGSTRAAACALMARHKMNDFSR